MRFKINDQVVYPAFGIGRVAAMVTKSFFEAESQLYYEVTGDRSTVWVQVDESATRGLRRLTRSDELARYHGIVSSQPAPLNQDHRQRQLDLRVQLKQGTMQCLCEVVRDLNARSWSKPLNEMDARTLRMSHAAVCAEWAAADGVPVGETTADLAILLLDSRQKYQA
jgi:CarD family transcriptional regulator